MSVSARQFWHAMLLPLAIGLFHLMLLLVGVSCFREELCTGDDCQLADAYDEFVCGRQKPFSANKPIDQMPWHVHILFDDYVPRSEPNCSAILVSESKLLTTADCSLAVSEDARVIVNPGSRWQTVRRIYNAYVDDSKTFGIIELERRTYEDPGDEGSDAEFHSACLPKNGSVPIGSLTECYALGLIGLQDQEEDPLMDLIQLERCRSCGPVGMPDETCWQAKNKPKANKPGHYLLPGSGVFCTRPNVFKHKRFFALGALAYATNDDRRSPGYNKFYFKRISHRNAHELQELVERH